MCVCVCVSVCAHLLNGRGGKHRLFLHRSKKLEEAQLSDGMRPDETQDILKLTKSVMGTLIQKVSDIKNKYGEFRASAKDTDSVCQNDKSMNTAPGRGEEDEINDSLNSVSDKGQEQTPHANRVSTDDKRDGCARCGNKYTHKVRLS